MKTSPHTSAPGSYRLVHDGSVRHLVYPTALGDVHAARVGNSVSFLCECSPVRRIVHATAFQLQEPNKKIFVVGTSAVSFSF